MDSQSGREHTATRGQRLATVLLYLSDCAGGGDTAFKHLKIRIAPQRGNALVFWNVIPGEAGYGSNRSRPHPHSLHAGMPVDEGGEKWVANLWLRARPPPALAPPPPLGLPGSSPGLAKEEVGN